MQVYTDPDITKEALRDEALRIISFLQNL